jgi:hypothetical protein
MTGTGAQFFAVTPCRIADTRGNGKTGAFGPPSLAGNASRVFPIAGACRIPSSALAYSLNVTVVPPGPLTYLTIWPAGQGQPVVSTLNSFDGAVVANAAIVPAGAGGSVSVFASNPTDLIIDVNGYFAAPGTGGLAFYPATPCRVADTRGNGFTGNFGAPTMLGGTSRDFPVSASGCGIPTTAQGYSLNMTVVPPGPLIYLSTWPSGQTQPTVSTLNSFDGRVVANAAIVPAGANGAISAYVSNASDVIIDINGYFAPPGGAGALAFYTVAPCRVADTRGNGFPTGAFGPPSMPANGNRAFPVPGSSCGIPLTAQAYSMNVTVVPPGPLTYLTAWPTGQWQPAVSTLNSFGGKVVANAAIVPAGQNGAVSVFVTNPTDVILDINGYFAP